MLLLLGIPYCILLYCFFYGYLNDFDSFYQSSFNYCHNLDPYHHLSASFISQLTPLPSNLNPPFFLTMLSPFTLLNYKNALVLWTILSLIFGSIGALISLSQSPSVTTTKQRYQALLIYLGAYATLMNANIGQIGGFLLFFIMAGYYFYRHNKDIRAGILWGVIIGLKVFPALLLIFTLIQRRYRVFAIMSSICVLSIVIPLTFKGTAVYQHYFTLFPEVNWYGDAWNASLQGFIYRLFAVKNLAHYHSMIQTVTLCFFSILFIWYIQKIRQLTQRHATPEAFALSLIMMLLMSPFGWLYYFPILLMPLFMIWQSLRQQSNINAKIMWIIAVCCLNLPLPYVAARDMHFWLSRASLYSCYFYGLLLVLYLFQRMITLNMQQEQQSNGGTPLVDLLLKMSLGLGVFVVTGKLFLHIVRLCLTG